MTYELRYSKRAIKDARKILEKNLKLKAQIILDEIAKDPRCYPHEKLMGDLAGCYSRRLNIQHRIVYEIFEKIKVVRILRMWSHYGDN